MKARVAAIHFALPETVLDNDQLAEEFLGWTAEKIFAKTGIRERRISGEDECASDLSVKAANALFDEEGFDRSGVDYLLNCTQSPDYILPTTACILQDLLGLSHDCGALDFNLGCSGYIYGLGLAKALIETGQASSVLLITADTYSKFIHPSDKSVRTLFGDAAAATLIRTGSVDSLTGPFVYGTDGSGAANLIIPTGGARKPRVPSAVGIPDESGNARTVNDLYQNGPEIFHFSLRVVPEVIDKLLYKADITMDNVDMFIFHQANRFILDHLRRKLRIPQDRFLLALEDVGNTVSSSIPIALKKAEDEHRLEVGSLLMLVGFGVGYSWGATLVRWVGHD